MESLSGADPECGWEALGVQGVKVVAGGLCGREAEEGI